MTGLGRQAPINDCYGAQRATAAIGPRPPIRVEWGTIAFGQSGLRVSDGLLAVSGQFRYQIMDGGLVNQFMR
jgi:hypothetical protein